MLTSRARCATRAMLELALRWEEGPIHAQDIAARQNVPLRFLHQILINLKAAGFVTSRTGRLGGYRLTRPPEEITLGAVVRQIDGPIAPISCVSVNFYRECGCPEPDRCAMKIAFREARDALSDILDATTFAQLRDRQVSLAAVDGVD